MSVLFTKKKIFFLIDIIGIVLLCMTAPFLTGPDNESYTVFDSIRKLPQTELQQSTIQDAFRSGSSSLWFYLIVPILAAIPLVSYISDEWGSRFQIYEKVRGGTLRYFRSRFTGSLCSSAVVLLLGLGIYLLVVSPYFPLNPIYPEGQMLVGFEETTIWELLTFILEKFGFLVIYSVAISMLASFFVLLYNDLYFDLSVTFILNYLLRDWFIGDRVQYPLIMIAVLIVLYIVIGKRGKKI